MQNYVREGGSFPWTNATGSTVTSGSLINLTDRVGVAGADIANGAVGTVHTKGVFKLAKDTTVFAAGADVDWDTSESKASDVGDGVAGDLLHIGKAVKAAATGDAYVEVEINVPITMELKA
ncbi:MAG: DUF2190 family protein [Opitutaceae bacterium]